MQVTATTASEGRWLRCHKGGSLITLLTGMAIAHQYWHLWIYHCLPEVSEEDTYTWAGFDLRQIMLHTACYFLNVLRLSYYKFRSLNGAPTCWHYLSRWKQLINEAAAFLAFYGCTLRSIKRDKGSVVWTALRFCFDYDACGDRWRLLSLTKASWCKLQKFYEVYGYRRGFRGEVEILLAIINIMTIIVGSLY